MPNRTGTPTAPAADNQGEGNRAADRRFREAQTRFAQDKGDVRRKARDAAPKTASEARDMRAAERAARAPARH